MSSIHISKTISVPGSPDLVWEYLTRPELVVGCLPGASLTTSSEDGLTHEGKMKVKLGALTVAYTGSAEFVELDPEARSLELRAKGREKAGSGTVSMTMRSVIRDGDSGTEIDIDSDVRLAGKLVSMGRGMIGAVADELLEDFSTCLADTLREAEAAGSGRAAGTGPTDGAQHDDGTVPAARKDAGSAEALSGLGILARALRRWVRGLFSR